MSSPVDPPGPKVSAMEKFEDFIKHVEVNLLPGCRVTGDGSRNKAPWEILSV